MVNKVDVVMILKGRGVWLGREGGWFIVGVSPSSFFLINQSLLFIHYICVLNRSNLGRCIYRWEIGYTIYIYNIYNNIIYIYVYQLFTIICYSMAYPLTQISYLRIRGFPSSKMG